MKYFSLFIFILCFIHYSVGAQQTYPVNGVADNRSNYFAFINATLVKDPQTTLQNATLVIKNGRIVATGNNIQAPATAAVIDCKGKYIYPSFIDLFSDYGITASPSASVQRQRSDQFLSNTKGAYGWNQAIKPETEASQLFTANAEKAKSIRALGFGLVLTHMQDGIARGAGAIKKKTWIW